MKAGIITLYGNYNYGNRLQNQAVSTLLARRGISSTTLIVRYGNSIVNNIWKYRNICREKINVTHSGAERAKNFKKYSESLPHEYILSQQDRVRAAEKYDLIVIGSDQIWHPDIYRHFGEQFASFFPSKRVMCLSPSFGVSQLPVDVLDEYRIGLERLPRLSVREEAGSKIIRELTGKDAKVLCDPTMGIDSAKWLDVSSRNACPNFRYAFAYFLGGLNGEDEHHLRQCSESLGLKYLNVLDKGNTQQYSADPNAFVGLIAQSSVVFTDSFHATVFSILLGRPVVIFSRREGVSTFSRLETLAQKFGLAGHILSSPSNLNPSLLEHLMDSHSSRTEEVIAENAQSINRFIDSELDRINS